jgi:hypothetical protein
MTIAKQYVQHNGTSVPIIEGSKGKGGGGGRIAPNSLFSSDIVFLTTAIGEGPVYRINPNGPQDIQIQDSSIDDLINIYTTGEVNTDNFLVASATGTVTQAPLTVFGEAILTPQAFASAVSLRSGPPSDVSVEDKKLYSPESSVTSQETSAYPWDAIRFIFNVDELSRTDGKGNVNAYNAQATIRIYNSIGTLLTVTYNDSGSVQTSTSIRVDFKGKTDKPYRRGVEVRIAPADQDPNGYRFDVSKTSQDSKDAKIRDLISLAGWVEIEYKRQSYPRTAIIGYGLKAANEHTGGIPTFTSMTKGLIVKVPSNYNQPVLSSYKTNTYMNGVTKVDVFSQRAGEIDWRELELSETGTFGYTTNGYTLQRPGAGDSNKLTAVNPQIYIGTWDGSFVYSWTQNPTWIIYDILTNQTYGLGIPEENIDKYRFYQVAQYCDACDPTTGKFIGVDGLADGSYRYKPRGKYTSIKDTLRGVTEGTPIKERRFITDLSIVDQEKSMDLLNKIAATFRGMLIYSGSKITLAVDMPGEYPVMQFNEATIKQGSFSISGTKESDVYTGVDVSYIDPTNHFKRETVRVDTADSNDGEISVDIENIATLDLAGVTRRSQAVRMAQYQIAASRYQRRSVSFTTGSDAINLAPGDVISIASRSSGIAYGYGGKVALSSDRNLINPSEDFTGSGWAVDHSSVTVTTNATTAPDGTLTADKLGEALTSVTYYGINRNPTGISPATPYTFSIYAKAAERNFIYFNFTVVGAVGIFDLTTGATRLVSGSASLVATDVGNGWWRCSVTMTTNRTAPNYLYMLIGQANSFDLANYAGSIGYGIYIWGAQLEEGYAATDYIGTPTVSANVVLEHFTIPALTDSVFTGNTYPLSLRILNQASDRLETYIISNTSFKTGTTNKIPNNSSVDIATVKVLSKFNKTSRTYENITSFTANVMPKAGDLWSLGELQNPVNYYSNKADKLFKVTNLKRDPKAEEIEVSAIEYISDVYIDSDTFINYQPTAYTDIASAFSTPPTPEFTITAVPRTKLDGTVVVDGVLSTNTQKQSYGPTFETQYELSSPAGVTLLSNVTATSPLTFLAANADIIASASGQQAMLVGKNGFSSPIGRVKLLCNAITLGLSTATFVVEGLSSAIDLNYATNILNVLPSLPTTTVKKGANKVIVPIVEKEYDPTAPRNFVAYKPIISEVSFDVSSYDTATNTITIDNPFINELGNSSKLSDRLPTPPFYITINQVLTAGGYSNNSFYVNGTEYTYIKSGTLVPGAQNVIPLDIKPRDTSFIRFYVDGIARNITGSINLNKTLTIDSNVLFTAGSSDTTYRLEADHYTAPAIEVGDQLEISAGNVFSVANSSFDISNAKYNGALTSNSIYRIELVSSPDFDASNYRFVNITQNPVGTISSVAGRSFAFDYNSTTYPGTYKLANSRIYSLEVDSNFERYYLTDDGYIPELRSGYTSVRARNKNTIGRYSPYVQKSIFVDGIPIQKVETITITESIYIEQLSGASVKVTISFPAIQHQQVTDYEISYKLSPLDANGIDDYNTVKVSAKAVDDTGRIRYTINNIDRGIKLESKTLTVRVTAINKNIRGVTAEHSVKIVGKTAPPVNVEDVSGGQQGDVIIIFWNYKRTDNGELFDLDLKEVEIRRLPGIVDINLSNYIKSEPLVTVAPPTASKTIPIDSYGTYTYFLRTFDTSGNSSDSIVGTIVTTVKADRSTTVAAWNEDNPSESFTTIVNNNYGEPNFPSFANSITSGVVVTGATVVDIANGSSSGWSIGATSTDLKATANAVYYTQIRDFGQPVTGVLSIQRLVSQEIQSTYNDQHLELQDSVTDTTMASFTHFNNVSVSLRETSPQDIFFSNTGSYMYVLGTTANANVHQYNLTSAWNVATAVYESNAYIGFRDTSPEGLFFRQDGKKMYFVGLTNDRVYEYDLATAWLVNTASYLQNVSIATQDTIPRSLTFSNTGTSMYVLGSNTDNVYQYVLGTPWNVTTASFTTRANVAPHDTTPTGFTFNETGTRAYLIGSDKDNISRYTLSEAWNVATMAYSSNIYIGNREGTASGLYVNNNESSIYFVGIINDRVFNYRSGATTAPNVLVDSDFGGIGYYLGFNNPSKSGYKYESNNRTWTDGTVDGNVFAIWNHGQFVNDVANANTYALIAGYINANAIALGNTYYANGMSTGGNTFANVTNGGASYTLVNLKQFNDVQTITYEGDVGEVTSKLYVRTATDNVYYAANGNVNTLAFSSSGDGWIPYTVGRSSFRYLQLRYEVANKDPASYDFILDKLRYSIDKEQVNYNNTFVYSNATMTIDYSASKFIKVPTIQVSVITTSDGTTNLVTPIFTAISNNAVNLRLANTNGTGYYPANSTATIMLSAQGV